MYLVQIYTNCVNGIILIVYIMQTNERMHCETLCTQDDVHKGSCQCKDNSAHYKSATTCTNKMLNSVYVIAVCM